MEGKKLTVSNQHGTAGRVKTTSRMRCQHFAQSALSIWPEPSALPASVTRASNRRSTSPAPSVLLLSQEDPGRYRSRISYRPSIPNRLMCPQNRKLSLAKLETMQLVVFNNWDMENVALADKTRIEKYRAAGRIAWTGEHEIPIHREETRHASKILLEPRLPAKPAPRCSPGRHLPSS